MNLKVFGRKRSWPNFGTIPVFARRDKEKLRNLQSLQLMSGPRFEPGTSRKLSCRGDTVKYGRKSRALHSAGATTGLDWTGLDWTGLD
jgi:hypothetical protein